MSKLKVLLDSCRGLSSSILVLSLAAPACAVAHAQSTQGTAATGGTARADATAASPADAASASASDSGAAAASGDGATTAAVAPYTGPRPYVFLRPPRVDPGLTGDQVSRLFRRNLSNIEPCYTAMLAVDPRARGVATARVTVIAGGMGTVESVRLSPANATFDACLRGVLGRLEWPNPRNAPASTVTMQIDLAPTPPPTAGRR